MKREITVVMETIEELKKAPGFVDKNGFYKYDRVNPGVVEDAIILLQHYGATLQAITDTKQRQLGKMLHSS